MYNKKHRWDGDWESEFHIFDENEITIYSFGVWTGLGLFFYFKDILVFLKIRKIAKIKKNRFNKNIQVQCPFCLNVSIRNGVDDDYFCLSCYKESYIKTSLGFSSLFMK